jgi:hypothetical protein
MGGSKTGGAHAAIYDQQLRPITAGGFVKSGPVIFKDIAKQAGLTSWQHVMGTPNKRFIIETIGSGVGLLDYDNDGWLDLYLVNGSTYDAMTGKTIPPHAALFHNNHDGTFTNVAEQAGVTNDRWGFGVAIGERTGCITTTTMGPSPMWRRRPELPWETGLPVRHGETTTAMENWTSLCPVMSITTWLIFLPRAARPWLDASFAG